MKRASKASKDRRPSKVDVIVIDDDEEPKEKSAKKKGERSSSAACEAEVCTESAEKLLDATHDFAANGSKKGLEDEHEKRLSALSTQLKEADKREESANAKELELTGEIASLKKELDAARKKDEIAKTMNYELATTNFTLKRDLDAALKREEAVIRTKDESTRELDALKIELAELRSKEEAANRMKDELARRNSVLNEELEVARRKENYTIHPATSNSSFSIKKETIDNGVDPNSSALAETIVTLTRENASLMGDLDKAYSINYDLATKNASLLQELELAKNWQAAINDNFTQQISALKNELEEANRKAPSSKEQLLTRVNAVLTGVLETVKKKEEEANKSSLEVSRENAKLKVQIFEITRKENIASAKESELSREIVELKEVLEKERKKRKKYKKRSKAVASNVISQ